jgi:hypothetical protein
MVMDGDINGDGYNDLIASARLDYYVRGKVYVYLGGEEMDDELDIYMEGEDNDQIGMAISYLGDLNKDSYDEFAVSGHRGEGYNPMVPSFTVFWGERDVRNVSWANSEKIIISGELPIAGITGLDDIDNDNNLDFALINSDSLFVFSYYNLDSQFKKISIGSHHDQQGFRALSNSNKLNNDDYFDFVVGVIRDPILPRGSVQIYYGNKYLEFTSSNIIVSKDSISDFGEGEIAIVNNFYSEDENLLAIGYSWIEKIGLNGFIDIYRFDETTNVEDEKSGTNKFELIKNYPNPFNPTTVIEYQIPEENFVNLSVYNVLGEKIKTLINKKQKTGKYKTEFTAENLPSGIYLINLTANDYKKTIKAILLK